MRDLLKASLITWVGAAAAMALALVRGKANAFWLGPAGVGTLAQLAGFVGLVSLVGAFSLGSGIAQYVARFRSEGAGDDVRRVVQTSLAFVLGFSLLLMAAVMGLAGPASAWLFGGDASQAPYIRLLALAIPGMSLIPTFQAIFNGYGEARLTALADLASAVVMIPLVAVAAWQWGLAGAILAHIALHAVKLLVQLFGFVRQNPGVLYDWPHAVDRRALQTMLKLLVTFAVAGLAMMAGDSAGQVFLRTQVIRRFGLEMGGFYQSAFAAANQVLLIGMGFLTTYAFALVNGAATAEERSARTNTVFHLALLVGTGGAGVLILLRLVYIRVLLSTEFVPAAAFFPLQAGGELMRQLGIAVGLSLPLTAGVRRWAAHGLIWGAGQFGFPALLFPLGAWAVPLPYFVTGLVYFLASWWLMRRYGQFRMSHENLLRLLSAAGLLIGLAALPVHWLSSMLGGLLLVLWAGAALGPYRRSAQALLRRTLTRRLNPAV